MSIISKLKQAMKNLLVKIFIHVTHKKQQMNPHKKPHGNNKTLTM